jgi:hypothetical protein
MPICKNCGGSNKKVVLNYTPKSYTICPDPGTCPESYNCSEILDAACIQYTSNNILYCGTSFVVINKFESLENAFASILEILCQTPPRCSLDIDIIPNPDDGNTPSLTTIVSNGLAPYTYKWEIAQGSFVGHSISGSSTSSSLNLNCIGSNSIMTDDIDQNIKISNIQLIVTDAEGCTEIVHFVYTSDCYPTVVDDPEARQPFLGGRLFNNNGYESKFALSPLIFLDDVRYIPTCPEMKNICCVEGYPDFEEAGSEYRDKRDLYFRDLNENILDENAGLPSPTNVLDYSVWEPDGLADQLIMYKGGLMNYNRPWGCPECTYRIWNEVPWPDLNNQTLAERFSMLDPEECIRFYWIDSVPFGQTPPTGQPGQNLLWQSDPLDPSIYYQHTWDPVTNSWSIVLSDIIDSINATNRQWVNNWLQSLNAVILAQAPFIMANEFALLHRFKYDLKYL